MTLDDMMTEQKLTGIITIPLHIGDFLSGTLHMDTLEKGAFIMLLLAHYQTGEIGLPNDDKKLARIAGVSVKAWLRIRPVLQEKFIVSEYSWRNSKAIEVLRKVEEKSSAQRAKALKRHNASDATAQPQHCQPKPKPKPVLKDISNDISKSAAFLLPAWIPEDLWNEHQAIRRKLRAQNTERAKVLLIAKLEQYSIKGHDIREIMETSIENSWKSFFEPKGNRYANQPTKDDRLKAAIMRGLEG